MQAVLLRQSLSCLSWSANLQLQGCGHWTAAPYPVCLVALSGSAKLFYALQGSLSLTHTLYSLPVAAMTVQRGNAALLPLNSA